MKALYPSKSVKYRDIKINKILNWKPQIHDILIKLNRANALLLAIRNFNRHILRTIYFAIFDNYISYANLIWNQNLNAMSRFVILQKKDLRIVKFQFKGSHSNLLFKTNYIPNVKEKMLIGNMIFINKSFKNLRTPILSNL